MPTRSLGGTVTIASLYLTQEGIVLGADSTSSSVGDGDLHFFDFSQKLLEVGRDTTFGFLTWGLGHVGDVSFRRLVALLGDSLAASPPTSVGEVAKRWVRLFKPVYDAHPPIRSLRNTLKNNAGRGKRAPSELPAEIRDAVAVNSVGFCIAGYVLPDRVPDARVITFQPSSSAPTVDTPALNELHLWGMPNVMNRLMYGVDQPFLDALSRSGKWSGTEEELVGLLAPHVLKPRERLPMRDAIDYVHSAIYCTIKAVKFSTAAQICGGPIEIAVITSDRLFRWVRHKPWHAAIVDGDFS